uniref:Uncharacterized protein n=1 Tax=Ananas comosus var. bracteatus TaxID=296719 RepID=A0A6V7NT96_ANACO|nr:unnamed protein product [Ananas comosus var. bracteatus]
MLVRVAPYKQRHSGVSYATYVRSCGIEKPTGSSGTRHIPRVGMLGYHRHLGGTSWTTLGRSLIGNGNATQYVYLTAGCPYSCVRKAPHAFSFSADNGKARAISQGHGDDYLVQLAVGRCPRRCIHYVTPSQRAILEDLLGSVLRVPYDLAEASLLDSLISKAKFENDRYQKPKRKPRASTEYVDWL